MVSKFFLEVILFTRPIVNASQQKIVIGYFHFPTESLTTKKRDFFKFGISLVYIFQNSSVLLKKVSAIMIVKTGLIQAKKKKKWRASSTSTKFQILDAQNSD